MKYRSVSRQPLHQQVAQSLREHITQHLKPGMRLEPEVQLAEQFDVSVKTIREALTTFAHEGLIERRAGRGTIVRERQSPAQHVAIIIGLHPLDPHPTFFPYRVTEQLYRLFTDNDVRVQTYWARYAADPGQCDSLLSEFSDNVRQGRVCGIVALWGPFDDRWRGIIRESRVPVVGGDSSYRVANDGTEVVREGTRYLLAAGRRRIALLGINDPLNDPERVQRECQRFRNVFRDAMKQSGATVRDEWIRADFRPTEAGAGYAQFKEIWTAAADKPDGLVIADDHLYGDFCTAVFEMNVHVPEQLLVVTQANKDSGVFYPFPTVRFECNPQEYAEHLGQMLLRLMRRERVVNPLPQMSFAWVGADAGWLEKEATTTARSPDLATKGT